MRVDEQKKLKDVLRQNDHTKFNIKNYKRKQKHSYSPIHRRKYKRHYQDSKTTRYEQNL